MTAEEKREARTTQDKRAVRITQQFREHANMAYDFDCAGSHLTLRIFNHESAPPEARWQIEGRTNDAGEPVTVSVTAASRAQALRDLAVAWLEKTAPIGLPVLDWEGVTKALTEVRAL
jgi:hypothetical protein